MYERFFDPPKESYFLFGPRGTGKSTWLQRYYPKAYRLDLLNPEIFRMFNAAPERLRAILETIVERTVVIDEIQNAPELLNVIHSMIEEKKGYQFIMTGSSARKLRRYGVNLLGGRACLCYMSPFFASEIKGEFDLAKNLKLGMLPLVLDASNGEAVLRAYVGVYLQKEVQAEGIVRNVGDFARFLEVLSFSHAALINTSSIARESGVARRTVDSYLTITNDLLLSFQLSVFRRKAKRNLATHSKFYFFDSGVYYSIRPKNFDEIETENEGAALEGLVAQHLKGWIEGQLEPHSLHFWRTQEKVEVDFVVSGPSCFQAIEVKNGKTLHPKDFKGLELFLQDYPKARGVILYRGKQRYIHRDILCVPVEEYLLAIHPKQALPTF